ncbi:hypothetical protein FIBSPDRAFT_1045244 [Athelia psychrophila]|uniref:HAD-like protein n=1 Tax=Athelia psychrophila TaxID=1759441 RepID=A0A166IH70_9AGAM|nr:hypothetical protein FIBSPDRAFT_1045244 [Fibularhizoctonia sp. CBS 109695]
MANRKIEYVIFDMDGLMIDSEKVYTEVTNNILGKYGKEMTWEMKAGCMGRRESHQPPSSSPLTETFRWQPSAKQANTSSPSSRTSRSRSPTTLPSATSNKTSAGRPCNSSPACSGSCCT